MEKLRRGNEVRVRRDKVAVIGRGAFVRTFCHCLSFFFLFFILSLPLSSTMQSSLLLRARAPVSSPRSVTTPKRSAAVMPLAATAVPTAVIFIYFPPPPFEWFPETNTRNWQECAAFRAFVGCFDWSRTSGAIYEHRAMA